MIWLPLLLLPLLSVAEDDVLKAVQDFENSLPDYNIQNEVPVDHNWEKTHRNFGNPRPTISFEEIRESGLENIHLQRGRSIVRIGNNRKHQLVNPINAKVFRQPDDQGFKYLLSEDSKVRYKVHIDDITPITEELALYEPPLIYTPAPPIHIEKYDSGLNIRPEVSFYAGYVNGDYIDDLFENSDGRGFTQQYGMHAFTDWNLPIKIGAALHYETTTFDGSDGAKVSYSAFSFGPQIKSNDFEWGSFPLRAQAQFRYSPFARAKSEANGQVRQFKFNSTDFLTSLEHPIKNRFGSFVIGAFVQLQWLSMKDQKELVSVSASNEINKSFGLSFSQVFE